MPPTVAIVGAGVVGVATARELSLRGLDCVVIERNAEPAGCTSFANAGRFCPAAMASGPLASPAAAAGLASSLWAAVTGAQGAAVSDPSPSRVEFSANLLSWGCRFLVNCLPSRHAANTTSLNALAELCKEATGAALADIEATLGSAALADVCIRQGTMYMLADGAALDKKVAVLDAIATPIVRFDVLREDTARSAFPFVKAWARPLPGVVHVTSDFTVDARAFTAALTRVCEKERPGRGHVQFMYNTEVGGPVVGDGGRVTALRTTAGDVRCDAVVLAAGLPTRDLAASWLGVWLPMVGMQGYSVDIIGATGSVPTMAVADYSSGPLSFQMTPLAPGTLRLIGHGEFVCGSVPQAPPAHCDAAATALLDRLAAVLPDVAFESRKATWCGLRPMTPDNLPIVSTVPGFANVVLDCGHGSMGWTSSCATAVLAADLVCDAVGAPCSPRKEALLRACRLGRFGWGSLLFAS